MTITIVLKWWYWAAIFPVLGVAAFIIREETRSHGGLFDIDFLSPLFFISGVLIGIGVVIGHFI